MRGTTNGLTEFAYVAFFALASSILVPPRCFSVDQRLISFMVTTSSGEAYGYKDSQGHVILAPKYDLAQDFTACGIGAVVIPKEGWTYIDRRGRKVITPLVFDNGPDDFREGLARFKSPGKVGFMNDCGQVVIPADYDFAYPFEKSYAVVCRGCQPIFIGEHAEMKGGHWGLIDIKGDVVIPLRYDEYSFRDAKFRNGEVWEPVTKLLRTK